MCGFSSKIASSVCLYTQLFLLETARYGTAAFPFHQPAFYDVIDTLMLRDNSKTNL